MKDNDKIKEQLLYLVDDTSGQGERGAETSIGSEILGILDALPFYVLLVDETHHILLANKAVSRDLGLDPKEIVGGYCPKVVHGLDKPFPGCPLEEAIEKGHIVERELFDPSLGLWMESAIYPTRYRTPDGRAVFLHMVHDITEKKKAEEEIQRHYQIQTVLNALLRISLIDISLEEQLELILEHIISIPWLALERKGGIFLVEDDPEVLVMKVQHGLATPLLNMCKRVPFGRCLCGRAALSGEVQFADRVDDRHENRYEGISPHGHYCVPILSAGKVLGVINLYLREGHRRSEREEEFLLAVADVLAGIIERKRAEEELRQSYVQLQRTLEGTVNALISAIEIGDPYTAGHQRRVTHLACAIANEMGLPQEQIEGLRMAGLIHDIGKISVPAQILSRPGPLNDLEFGLIKTHSQVGCDILNRTIEFPWPVAQIVLQHHERMDGSGYPAGLSGEEILLEARILAVADVVEAMASHRPYRPARGMDKALEEISQNRGVLYDPKVVDVCLKLFTEKGFKFE